MTRQAFVKTEKKMAKFAKDIYLTVEGAQIRVQNQSINQSITYKPGRIVGLSRPGYNHASINNMPYGATQCTISISIRWFLDASIHEAVLLKPQKRAKFA